MSAALAVGAQTRKFECEGEEVGEELWMCNDRRDIEAKTSLSAAIERRAATSRKTFGREEVCL